MGKTSRFATGLVAAALVSPLVALGVAGAAHALPEGSYDAEDVIGSLEAEGNYVIITRIGSAPLSRCEVTNVRMGAPVYRYEFTPAAVGFTQLAKVIDHGTAYVDLKC